MSITRDYVKEAESLYASSPDSLPIDDVVQQIYSGQMPFENDISDLIPKRKVSILVSSTYLDTKFEQDVLFARAFPALRRIFTSLELEFSVVWMRSEEPTRMKNQHILTDVLVEQLNKCIAESAGVCMYLLFFLPTSRDSTYILSYRSSIRIPAYTHNWLWSHPTSYRAIRNGCDSIVRDIKN